MTAPVSLSITSQRDVYRARGAARELLTRTRFDKVQAERVVLVVSELSTNLMRYGRSGEITVTEVHDADRSGVRVEARDLGPGIPDLAEAMRDGCSTGGGLGSGLPAVRRLMDEFGISSSTHGTIVVTCKWLKT